MPLILVAALAVALLAGSGALAQPVHPSVGFQSAKALDQDGILLDLSIWYPSIDVPKAELLGPFLQVVAPNGAITGQQLPLIVMSHGSGGASWNHYNTALALARAGFVVVAPTHPGDNQTNHSRAGAVLDRPEHVSLAIDYMVSRWSAFQRIDFDRIGFFGFALGGFTGLVATGGAPDFALVADHCRAAAADICCTIVKPVLEHLLKSPPTRHLHDSRIGAAVLAAPALSFAFSAKRLAGTKVPIQLWQAEHDNDPSRPSHADAIRQALPVLPDYRLVAGAGHFDFIAPCTPQLAATTPLQCESRPSFDRVAFHDHFNKEVVAFFMHELKAGSP